jgi:hypothetical protein
VGRRINQASNGSLDGGGFYGMDEYHIGSNFRNSANTTIEVGGSSSPSTRVVMQDHRPVLKHLAKEGSYQIYSPTLL